MIKNKYLTRIIDDSQVMEPSVTRITKAKQFNSNVGGLFLEEKDKSKRNLIKKALESDRRVKKVIINETEGFPDLFIILNDKFIFNHESSFFVIRGRNSIFHSEHGLFMAYGKNIKQGSASSVSYKDIAPTILKMYEIEKLPHMTGNSLDIFKEIK